MIYSHLDVKVVKNLIPLHSDANQSQGGDMKRKSHWPITAQDITASWTPPPIGIFTLIDWHGDVVWGGGVSTASFKMDLKENQFILATRGNDELI